MKARRLASGRNPRWALWDRFTVPNYDSDGNYLTRWRIIQTPFGGIYLHRLDGPDPRTTLHDHPWPFISFVVRGGYVERHLDPNTMQVTENRVVRRINRKHPFNAHAITRLLRTPTWTLLFVGRRVRTWGYMEPKWRLDDREYPAYSWKWTEFDKHFHAHEFEEALERRKAASQ